jgi:hypothetical protein
MQNASPEEETGNSKIAIASVLRFLVKKIRFAPTTATRNVTKFTIYHEGIVGDFRLSHRRRSFKCNEDREINQSSLRETIAPTNNRDPLLRFSLAFPTTPISERRKKANDRATVKLQPS